MTISVIIPIYNTSEALRPTVKSLLAQTFQDFEVVFVDDGSTDNSADICREYCAADPRFRLIQQANQGPAGSRNTGMAHAKGDFFYFLDSDDAIHPRMLELLLKTYRESDGNFSMCLFKMVDRLPDSYDEPQTDVVSVARDEMLESMFSRSGRDLPYMVLWNKLYPRQLLEGLTIKEIVSEDTEFNLRVYLRCQKAAVLQTPLYYYLQHNQSVTHQDVAGRRIRELDTYHLMLNELPQDHKVARAACIRKLYMKILNVRYLAKGTDKEQDAKQKIRSLKKATWKQMISNSALNWKNKSIIVLLYLFPKVYQLFFDYNNK